MLIDWIQGVSQIRISVVKLVEVCDMVDVEFLDENFASRFWIFFGKLYKVVQLHFWLFFKKGNEILFIFPKFSPKILNSLPNFLLSTSLHARRSRYYISLLKTATVARLRMT